LSIYKEVQAALVFLEIVNGSIALQVQGIEITNGAAWTAQHDSLSASRDPTKPVFARKRLATGEALLSHAGVARREFSRLIAGRRLPGAAKTERVGLGRPTALAWRDRFPFHGPGRTALLLDAVHILDCNPPSQLLGHSSCQQWKPADKQLVSSGLRNAIN
jgi:hypothetical protein